MKAILVVSIGVICVVILQLFLAPKQHGYNKSLERWTDNYQDIPNVIWTYWHDPLNIPPLVQRCIKTWQLTNPTYTINILNDAKIKELFGSDIVTMFPNVVKSNIVARQADLARALVMAKYGGFWIDASTICTESLNWVHRIRQQSGAEMIAFYAPHTTDPLMPIIENWFFAAVRGSAFVNDWLAELKRMESFDSEAAYIAHVKKNKEVDMQHLEHSLPYLVMHLCAAVVLQRDPNKYNLHLFNGLKGPLMYMDKARWKQPEGFKELCEKKENQTPIIKMRSTEREYLEKNGFSCNTNNPYVKMVINTA